MTKKQKKTLYRIIVAAVLLVAAAVVCELAALPWWAQLVLHLAPYLVIGYDVLRKAVLGIVHGEVFDENFLMAIATVGAMAWASTARRGRHAVLPGGRAVQSYAVGKSRRSIAALMDIRPDSANLENPDGSLRTVSPEEGAGGRGHRGPPRRARPAGTAWCWRAVPA